MGSKLTSVLRVFLLPALGTDAFLYEPILAALSKLTGGPVAGPALEIESLQYRASQPGEELAAYIRRQYSEQYTPGRKFDVVLGTSLGGMAAQELIASGLIQSKRLVLISTCFSGRDFSWLVRLVAPTFPLLPYIPRRIRRALIAIVAWAFPIVRRGIPNPAAFRAMIRRADPDFLFASSTMISRWRSDENPVAIPAGLAKQVFHIQGRRDPVMSYKRIRRQREPEVTVATGDHIMILNRAPELAEYVFRAGFWSASEHPI